jgi:hypothetical protein
MCEQSIRCARRASCRGFAGLGDAHDLQLIGDRLAVGADVAQFLGLPDRQIDRFAL